MNFFVNKAMGIGNSGVEHAEFYRAKCFDIANMPYKYVFTELVKNLHEAMEAWQIPENKVINLWEMLVLGDDYVYNGAKKAHEYKHEIEVDFTNTHRMKKTFTSSGMLIIEHIEKSVSKKKPDILLVSEYKIDMYNAQTMQKKVSYKILNHPNRGRLMQNIHIRDFEGQNYFFRNEVLLHRFFFNYLREKFEGTLNFFIDRGQETESALLHNCPVDCNLIEIVHADHLSDRDVPSAPLWNNYYEYALNRVDLLDRIVVATELQRADLLIDFPDATEKIVTIPVGGIRDFKENDAQVLATNSKPMKFITASRLASEKHIDVIVRALHKIRKDYPNVTLDIYGQGAEDVKIKEVIAELQEEEFIKLKGLSHNLDEIYHNYDAFISASYSEGFGLTYIEALDGGLPIVTFNARFGATELVQDGVNGFLQEFSRTDEQFSVDQLAEGIKKLLESDYATLKNNTRKSVEQFQDSIVASKWRGLVDAL